MKGYYKTVLWGDAANVESICPTTPEDVCECVLEESIEPCCIGMTEALEDEAIFWGEYEKMLNSNTDINIAVCHPYPEGAVWNEYPITYCPFCGEKIETIERKRVKLKKVDRTIPSRKVVDYEEVDNESN